MDSWRLAVGTLTAIRVAPPRAVDRAVAGRAMLLAPLAVLPLSILVVLGHLAVVVGLPEALAAVLVVAALAWSTRAIHLDGLADTADGFAASAKVDRGLEVMRRGDVGPMGVVTVVLVLGVQVVALASILPSRLGSTVAAFAIPASRCALVWACRETVPAARPDGLGQAVARSVRPSSALLASALATVGGGLAVLVVVAASGLAAWSPMSLVAALALAGCVVAVASAAGEVVTRRAVRRLGGITGDTLGAAVEVAWAAALVGLAVVITAAVAGGAPAPW